MAHWQQLNNNLQRLRSNVQRKRWAAGNRVQRTSRIPVPIRRPRQRLSLVELRSKQLLRTRLIAVALLILTMLLLIKVL